MLFNTLLICDMTYFFLCLFPTASKYNPYKRKKPLAVAYHLYTTAERFLYILSSF